MKAFAGRRIVIGVTGSIAIYKTCDLVFALGKAGARPAVVMSESATRLVTPETFRALAGDDVHTRLFGHRDHAMPHIALAEQADLVLVAPATAHFLAQAALGLGDDLLATLLHTPTCPVIIAPAMNVNMWAHPAVARNVERLRQDGVTIIEPVEGHLACRVEGKGKMAPVEEILRVAGEVLER